MASVVYAGRADTQHYRVRSAERSLRPGIEEFIVTWGTEIHLRGAVYLTIVRKDLPKDVRNTYEAVQAEDWVLVTGDYGRLVTCYRMKNAWHVLRRQSNRRT